MNAIGRGRDAYRWSRRLGTTAIAVSLFVVPQHLLVGLAMAAGGLLCYPAGRAAWWWGWRHHTRRLMAIGARPDGAAEALRLYENMRENGLPEWPPPQVTGTWLVVDEQFQAGYDRLTAIDVSTLDEATRTRLLNNRAWALAHLGRADEALPLATQALSRAEPAMRPYVLCTLGTAYLKAGRALEGVPFLAESASLEPGEPGVQAIRLRCLGDGLAAVGRAADARAAYQRAIETSPGSRAATLAQERLAALDATRG